MRRPLARANIFANLTNAPGMVQHFKRSRIHAGITNSTNTPIRLITVHIVAQGHPLNVPVE